MKKVKHKKVKRKKAKPEFCCDVPNCTEEASVGWMAVTEYKRVCVYHVNRHHNENDDFDLNDVFGIPKIGFDGMDRFGFKVACDAEQFEKRTKIYDERVTKKKKEDSMGRLKQWKDKNKDLPKVRKPKPRPEVVAKQQEETDDIVANILED